MSLISALLQGFGPAQAAYSQGSGNKYTSVFAGGPGVPNEEYASITMPAVYACVRLLAETVGTLPLLTYRRTDSDRERVTDDPRATMLHSRPNPAMTSVEFYETVMGHLLLWGNAYVYKHRGPNGQIDYLWPLAPVGVDYRRDEDGTAWFVVGTGDDAARYPAASTIHFRGFGSDGQTGYSPIGLFRKTIVLGKTQEQYAQQLFANQARPGGILKTDRELSDVAFERLKAEWSAAHSGALNSGKTAFLENGVSWEQLGMPPSDTQFLEQRKYQASEIARIFRVPPHMIGDLDRATFSNIEQQSIDFVTHSLRPWLRRLETRLTVEVYDDPVRDADLYCEFVVDALLRGDTATRYAAYGTAIEHGYLTRNEARQRENLPPIDGLDEPIMPLNMGTTTQAVEAAAAQQAARDADADESRRRHDELVTAVKQEPVVVHNHVTTPDVTVHAPPASFTVGDVIVQAPDAPPRRAVRSLERDANGDIVRVIEEG